jgi:hypothetical protein
MEVGGESGATTEEQEKVIETEKLTIVSAAKDFTNPNGWSTSNTLTGWPQNSHIELDGETIDFFMTLKDSNREVSLDVQLPGRARERILEAKSRLHLVSRAEHRRNSKPRRPQRAARNTDRFVPA